MCRNNKGVSTILGTLIFIGIVFSAIVPMNLVMKQADIVYDQRLHEADAMDEEKAIENLLVLAYPDEATDKVTIKVQNRGAVQSKIVRVWINSGSHETDASISVTKTENIGSFSVNLTEETFVVKVTTEKGNIFTSGSGSLYYEFSSGMWITPSLGICVNVVNFVGKFRINVTLNGAEVGSYETQGIDWGDIVQTFLINETSVNYVVKIEKKQGSDWVNLPGTPVTITMDYPNGSPLKYVFADGTGI